MNTGSKVAVHSHAFCRVWFQELLFFELKQQLPMDFLTY